MVNFKVINFKIINIGDEFIDFKVPVEVSARHIHLSKNVLCELFGSGYNLNFKRELSQKDQFLCLEKLDLVCGQYSIKGISILGPLREYCQIEISITDSRKLKIDVPIRESGNIIDSAACTLVGPKGIVGLHSGLIVAKRHIHMEANDAKHFNISSGCSCSLKVNTEHRPIIFKDVIIRVDEKFSLAAHIDTDEANAAGIFGYVLGEALICVFALLLFSFCQV